MNPPQPTKVIPRRMTHRVDLNLGSRRMTIGLNLLAVILLVAWGWVFVRLAAILRPALLEEGPNVLELSSLVPWPTMLGAIVGILLLHELVHGAFFWLYTHERPRFGIGLLHAYAAAPDWYLPRNQFIVVGLAPLALISAAGILLLPFLPLTWLPALLLALIVNASGAVGDLYVVARLLPQPRAALTQDTGAKMSVFSPVANVREALTPRWQRLFAGFGVSPPASAAIFEDLCTRYTVDRHYHNLEHIMQLHELADRFGQNAQNRPALDLAIWYHDIIYDPLASDNEARSATYMLEALHELVPSDILALAANHIEATTHSYVPEAPDTRLLLDLDLASFANSRPNYLADTVAIRQEFVAVPEAPYRAGRQAILNRFLARPRLYLTETLEHLEQTARRNIKNEIEALQA